jgi:hypothetical protein
MRTGPAERIQDVVISSKPLNNQSISPFGPPTNPSKETDIFRINFLMVSCYLFVIFFVFGYQFDLKSVNNHSPAQFNPNSYNPMKTIEYWYFTIYNHFYQRSYHSRDFFARIQAMYLFSFSAGGWILFLEAAYLRILKHAWFSSKQGAIFFAASVYFLTAIFFYHIFIVNERDRKIFGKYEEKWDRNPKKKRDLLIAVLLIVIPYAMLVSLSIFFPRHT